MREMEPFVARAFLNKLLSEDERKSLRDYEVWLQNKPNMQNRYLTGSEICRRFHLKPDPLTEDDVDRMELLVWKWKERYSTRYDEAAKVSGDKPPEIFTDWFDEFDNWIQFAEENYERPSMFSTLTCFAVVPLVLMFAEAGR